jgi:O-antigen ligase
LLVLGMLVIGVAGLVRQWTLAGILAVTAVCTAMHLAVGVIAEVWLGTFTPFQPGYRFAGTLHPNQQGINCALLAFGAFFLARGAGSARGRSLALLAGWTALLFLLLTRSRTAAAAAVAGLLLMYVLGGTPWRRAVAGAAGACLLALLLLLQANGVLGASPETFLLGRQDSNFSTLSGRTDIWSYALRHALERPVLGYGYNGFWSPRHTAEVSAAVDWKISEGHSAYLDTLLTLGAVGLMLFAALLAIGLVAALREFRFTRDGATAAAAGLLLFGALDAVLESAMVLPNLLSFTTLAVLAGLALRARPGAAPEPKSDSESALRWPVQRSSDHPRPAGVSA